MRFSGLFAIAVLLLSSPLFAQHSSSAATPASPPPATSSAASATSAASVARAAIAPAVVNGSTSQPSNSSATGHASTASPQPNSGRGSGSAVRSNDSDLRRSVDPKPIENDRIAPSPRVGEHPRKEEKEAESKERSDLRKKICVGSHCEQCSSGEAGKNGNCVPTTVTEADPCATFSGRAAIPEHDVRAAKTQMQNTCATDPSGDDCDDLKQRYDGAVQRYRMLLNEAPANCRALLPDPLAL